jgi:Na+-driven multidrug efflux pump
MIHRPQVNFYKVLIMLAANIIFDFVGIWVLGNVYGVTITSVIPTIIAVVISFYELNKYKKFNFLSVYSRGFDESKLLVRQGLKAVRL